MTIQINGTSGISGVDGSAATPAFQGTDTNTGISFGTDTVNINTGGTTRATVDSSGRVGIGTSSPGQALDVAGIVRTLNDSPGNGFIVKRTGGVNANGGIDFVGSDDVADASIKMATDVANALTLHTAGSERLRVTSAGLVGIGTTTIDFSQFGSNTGGVAIADVGSTNTGLKISDGSYHNYLVQAGNGNFYISHYGAGDTIFSNGASGEEAFRIDASRRLLVGTSTSATGGSSAYARLQVNGNPGGTAAVIATGSSKVCTSISNNEGVGYLIFTDNAAAQYAWIGCEADGASSSSSDTPGRLTFATTPDGSGTVTERMRITRDGYLFFKKTSTGLNTDGVEFQDTGGGARVFITQPGNGVQCLLTNNRYGAGTQTAAEWCYAGSAVGSVTVTSSSTAYNTSSDYRLKENITPVIDGITRLQQLKPSRFNFIADPDKTVDGFIAHEVQGVVPEAIHGEKDAVDDEGNPKYQGIDQSKLVPLLTAALQEAITRIETLEAEVTALKGGTN